MASLFLFIEALGLADSPFTEQSHGQKAKGPPNGILFAVNAARPPRYTSEGASGEHFLSQRREVDIGIAVPLEGIDGIVPLALAVGNRIFLGPLEEHVGRPIA